jgi:glycosyltransferase involved in cell wall biosynthesis
MLKIVVVGTRGLPGIQGGVERHCEQLYPHIVRQGYDVTVFTRRPYMSSDIKTYRGVSLIPLNCNQNIFLEAFSHTFKSVLKARRLHPDILHIHAIGPSFFTPLARSMGMKVIVTHHGPDYMRIKWPLPAKIFLKSCEWIGMTFANEIIAIAENISNEIRQKFKRSAHVIPNGVEIPELIHSDKILKKLSLQMKKYILAVGRFVPEKGFDILIDAYNQSNFKEWKLVIVGDADHENKYSRDLKAKSGKNKNIIFTGFLSGQPLQELYSHAGFFVLPSYYEGLPIVLLEAMSYGLLCIASDIPAHRNVGLGEESVFKAGDATLLSNKMKDFIDKAHADIDKGSQMRKIAEKYNWEQIAYETTMVYEKTISSRN